MEPSLAGPSPSSRFRGCLLAGAAGDALGAAVEFEQLPDIQARFGSAGIRDLAPCFGRLGAITADTQLTLFTTEGLIRTAVLRAQKGAADPAVVVQRSYLRWLKAQGETAPVEVPMDGWVTQLRALRERRGPGLTCQSALRSIEVPGMPAHNDSAGNGAVTHIAPVGLLTPAQQAFEAGEQIAGLTHGHPGARLAAGMLASVIARLVQGDSLGTALKAARATLRERPGHAEVLAATDKAESLAAASRAGGGTGGAVVESLGGGWVATEALSIALYCLLATSSLEEAVILAVNHSGDSDSTGALTGSLAGTLYGAEAIPARWTEDLELREEITALADDLQGVKAGTLDLRSPGTLTRYPGS
jgi:ADP-ribosylglycohydrolase